MKRFPNKMIREAYESAKGKVFNKHSQDLTCIECNVKLTRTCATRSLFCESCRSELFSERGKNG